MFERSELRSSQEGREQNGVKNLNGAKTFPKTYSYHEFGDVYSPLASFDIIS
jgi:hypothetical protein